MRKKGTIILALVLCFWILLSGCDARKEAVKEGETFIYYLNDDLTGLVKSKYTIGHGSTKEEVLAMLKEMQKNPEDIDRYSVFPKDVEILGVGLENGYLLLDVSSAYDTTDVVRQTLFRAAVVQSLAQIEGIHNVGFSVAGNPMKDVNGVVIGFQNADDFVQNTGSALHSYQTETLEIYFANKAGDKLVAQSVDVKYSSNVPIEKVIVEQVLSGPAKDDAYPTLSSDIKLLGVTSKEGICYVNLNEAFLNNACDVIPEVAVYSLVNSIVNGADVTQVQISVNGETQVTYKETFDLSKPLMSDPRLISNEN